MSARVWAQSCQCGRPGLLRVSLWVLESSVYVPSGLDHSRWGQMRSLINTQGAWRQCPHGAGS